MIHVDPSHLVELALGHASGDEDADALRHVASCPRCRRELARMTHVVAAARGVQASDLPVAPPDRVWQRIVQEVLHEADRLPHPGRHPARRFPAGETFKARSVPTAYAGACGGFLALALAAGVLLVRWLRVRSGRGPDRRLARRRRSPWWRRAC